MDLLKQFWTILKSVEPFWMILEHIGQCWTILNSGTIWDDWGPLTNFLKQNKIGLFLNLILCTLVLTAHWLYRIVSVARDESNYEYFGQFGPS